MSKPLINLVVARARNGIIGRDGRLPWRLRRDMQHFRSITIGKPIIMGRKTFESLPKLLDCRRHIVLTRDAEWFAPGVDVVHTVAEALRAVASEPEVSVIGGAEIYRLFLQYADKVWLTEVHADPEGDTSLPPFSEVDWRETHRLRNAQIGDEPAHDFVVLERRCRD